MSNIVLEQNSADNILKTDRTTVRRMPERGAYDRDLVHSILDEALLCHVGFIAGGSPFVIPTIHARIGDTLYVHGSPASRMLRSLKQGIDVCVTVTLLDGLVLARSAFHHSMNYRSAVILGNAREVSDRAEKTRALDALVEHVMAGRTRDARGANEDEMRKTLVLAVPITEASAKVRAGGPTDDEEDYALPIWAGVLPLRLVPQEPVADTRLPAGIEVPEYVADYHRPKRTA
jgi:nitroimidazol reductase NimA-like FMN-containing flavoprotein (pyridoxamine 5'-phosphate oxidase superfamily)